MTYDTSTARGRRRRVAGAASLALVAGLGLSTFASVGVVSASPGGAHSGRPLVRQVSARMPVTGGTSVALSALRPAGSAPSATAMTAVGPAVNTWTNQATLVGAVVHDVDFPTPKIGYAAAELGQVWKTTDGGATWTKILNRGFPYYYYGVEALSRQRLVVSGFNNQTSEGILTWSSDGGATWSADEVVSPNAWVGRVRMPGSAGHGLAMNGGGSSGSAPNAAWYTTKPNSWQQVTPDPAGGWFGNQFTLLPNHDAYASGITYCSSTDTGATWGCKPSIDPVFDGPTAFINDTNGWVGGGEISPDVSGWLHRTTNGGATWSGRVLQTPYPIRQIEFLSPKIGWATGGNIYSNVGGMYYTSDGGKTWALDSDTGEEMGACSHHTVGAGNKTRVWCIGSVYTGSNFNSTVYRTTVATPGS